MGGGKKFGSKVKKCRRKIIEIRGSLKNWCSVCISLGDQVAHGYSDFELEGTIKENVMRSLINSSDIIGNSITDIPVYFAIGKLFISTNYSELQVYLLKRIKRMIRITFGNGLSINISFLFKSHDFRSRN